MYNNYNDDKRNDIYGGFKDSSPDINNTYPKKDEPENSKQENNDTLDSSGYYSVLSPGSSYKEHEHSADKKKKKKKEKKPSSGFGIRALALCLACVLIGAICGAGAGYLAADRLHEKDIPEFFENNNIDGQDNADGDPDVVLGADSDISNMVQSNISDGSGEDLTANQIYTLYCQSTVGISASITTNVFGQTSTSSVTGSGFIISSDGYIATNYHVVEDAYKSNSDIEVIMYNGDTYSAQVIGYEEDNDVAVLKIETTGLQAVILGNSNSISVGNTTYALGNPLGELTYTFTSGIISALDREIHVDTNTSINMFQFDAAVNSGNSGGPAINSKGEVIGIVTAKYADTGVEGLAFAVPINDAMEIIEDIIENGYVTGKAYLGVSVLTVSSSVAQYYNMVEGVYVYTVYPGSCAEEAGLKDNDIIVAVDDYEVLSVSDLNSVKRHYSAGDTAELTVYRNGEYLTLSITFDEEQPSVDQAGSSAQGSQGNRNNNSNQPNIFDTQPN